MTLRADGLAAISGQHNAVLDFVLVLGHHIKECIYAGFVPPAFILAATASVPQVVFLRLSKLVVRREYGEVVLLCVQDEIILPFHHLVTAPANHRAVINAQCAVGDNQ